MTHPETDAQATTASDAGQYEVYWREVDSDQVRFARVLIIDGYTTLADTANIIAIRHLPIGRMRAERVVILVTLKVDGGDQ